MPPFSLPLRALIAHRGASADAPENTLEACILAVQERADAIEIDLQLTLDGRLAVVHDRDLTRLAHDPLVVEDSTFDQLLRADVSGGFRASGSVPISIPSLEQVLDALPEFFPINLELKQWTAPRALYAERLTDAIRERTHVLVSSFDHELLHEVRAVMPECLLAPLFSGSPHEADAQSLVARVLSAARDLDASAVNVNHQLATRRLAQSVADFGWPLLVYTVDDAVLAAALFDDGAAGIFTNRPGALRRELAP